MDASNLACSTGKSRVGHPQLPTAAAVPHEQPFWRDGGLRPSCGPGLEPQTEITASQSGDRWQSAHPRSIDSSAAPTLASNAIGLTSFIAMCGCSPVRSPMRFALFGARCGFFHRAGEPGLGPSFAFGPLDSFLEANPSCYGDRRISNP